MKITASQTIMAWVLWGVVAALPVVAWTGQEQEDEQIVIDDLTPAQLRAEIEKIENEIYRVWNQLNGDDSMDIICHDYTPAGSNIKREACEPQFVIDRRGENAADSRLGTDELLSSEGLRADLAPEFRQLTEAMGELAEENQYFRELNLILQELSGRMEEL
ncbi:MAG: hypothetical protein ACR2PR_00020 [Pseudohongiellaceae bacterium]